MGKHWEIESGRTMEEVNKLRECAPELLEACKRAWEDTDNTSFQDVANYLKQAIAKAEGRE